jgi:hypothetical protein
MKYPEWLFGRDSLMALPKSYQEYFIRWYYYDNSDETQIPDTIPVENIEEYIVEHMNAQNLWCAKGFAVARNIDDAHGNNIMFKSDSEFMCVVHFVAKLWFKTAIKNDWIKEDITKDEFEKECHILRYGGSTSIHL